MLLSLLNLRSVSAGQRCAANHVALTHAIGNSRTKATVATIGSSESLNAARGAFFCTDRCARIVVVEPTIRYLCMAG